MPPGDLDAHRCADGSAQIASQDLTVALHRLTGWALEKSVSLDDLRVLRPSLEDVYLQLTGPTLPHLDEPAARGRTAE